jgi:hypothetical protein
MSPKPSDSFEYPDLTPLSEAEPPDYDSLQLLQLQINANAMTVHSSKGDGISGLLTLTVSPDKYLLVSGGATEPIDVIEGDQTRYNPYQQK